MKAFFGLIDRNIKNFYRAKSNVFFATLSVLIIVLLHFLIFQDMNSAQYIDVLEKMGMNIGEKDSKFLADSIMFAAVVPVGAITLSLVTLGLMVQDKQNKAFNSFLVAPVKRTTLLLSYLVSSVIVGLIVLTGFILFFEIYFLILYGISFSILQFLYILLAMLAVLIFSNMFMLLIVSFLKNEQALGALGAILGVLIGFISGAYMPISMFGDTLASIFNMLPFAGGTLIFRRIFLLNIEKNIGISNSILENDFAEAFGLKAVVFDNTLSLGVVISLYLAVTLLLTGFAIWRFKKIRNE